MVSTTGRTRLLLLLVSVTACGGQSTAVFSYTEKSATAIDGGVAAVAATVLPAAVNLIATGPNYAIASTAQGPYRLVSGEQPQAMMLVLSTGDGGIENPGALSVATSRAISPTTPVTSVIAVVSEGLVQDFADVFELSPLAATLDAPVSALDDIGGASVPEVVWAGSAGALYEVSGGLSQRFEVATETGAPTAVLAVGDHTLAAFGSHLYELDPSARVLTPLEHDFGNVVAMARGADGGSYLASDQGLFAFSSATGGEVSHYPVGSVSSLTVDPLFGAYAATDDTLLALPFGGTLCYVGSFPDKGPHPLATDGFGNVWAGSGSSVLEFQAGSPVGYVNDVKPFFAANCYSCHVTGSSNGSPRLPFDDYEGSKAMSDAIVQHLTGDGVPVMPPAPPVGNGPLDPSVYGVVIRWVNTGELP
jgi:hypothetical protein